MSEISRRKKKVCARLQSIQSVAGFLSVVRIGSPPAPSLARECCPPPPLAPGGIPSLGGGGEPIQTKGQTLWYSRYSIIFLRARVRKDGAKKE
jgi:hypothetical protein